LFFARFDRVPVRFDMRQVIGVDTILSSNRKHFIWRFVDARRLV